MSTNNPSARFATLDGWRGISILCVLTAHLLPLGPEAWQINATAGPMGMALFFALSGFLITHFLLNHAGVGDFLIRRFFRIVPLAWLYLCVALLIGATLAKPGTRLASALNHGVLFYLAAISYALYVIHPLLAESWLGSGETLEKYIKRPLLFVVLLALAHLSTFHFEHKWIALGKRLSGRLRAAACSVPSR